MFSIIIPTYNEAHHIAGTINYLQTQPDAGLINEIIVVDGHSTDDTLNEVRKTGSVLLLCPEKGRSVQMNYGAAAAKGEVLYFLHADTRPPHGFLRIIQRQLAQGISSGCFCLKFDEPHWFINSIALLTRLDTSFVRFGDQSLYITRTLFSQAGGYNTACIVMEDHEIIPRIKRSGKYKLMSEKITTSSRKFMENGPYRLMFIYLYIYLLYYMKTPQDELLKRYRKLIRNGKL